MLQSGENTCHRLRTLLTPVLFDRGFPQCRFELQKKKACDTPCLGDEWTVKKVKRWFSQAGRVQKKKRGGGSMDEDSLEPWIGRVHKHDIQWEGCTLFITFLSLFSTSTDPSNAHRVRSSPGTMHDLRSAAHDTSNPPLLSLDGSCATDERGAH